jgi:hypothetical protein
LKLSELAPALKDAVGLEIQPDKRYLIFVDPATCHVSGLRDLELGIDVQVIFLAPIAGKPMAECVAAYCLEPVEHDAGGMEMEGDDAA